MQRSGAVECEERAATPRGATAIVDALVEVVGRLGPLSFLGIGAAGLVDDVGVVRAAPNLPGVFDLPLRDLVAERLGIDVVVANDATCAALAEWRLGAARGAHHAAVITLGTGIGGGFVTGGSLLLGANGFAGEPGHMVVDPSGPRCVCGQRGCWERYASGAGLARMAREAAMGGRLDAVVASRGGDPEAVRAEDLGPAARAGDEGAQAVFAEFARWTALGIVNLVNLLDLEVVVLGGGLVAEAGLFLPDVRRFVDELLYFRRHRPSTQIVAAELGDRAGAIGAALLRSIAPS